MRPSRGAVFSRIATFGAARARQVSKRGEAAPGRPVYCRGGSTALLTAAISKEDRMSFYPYRNESLIQLETYETDPAHAEALVGQVRKKWALLREEGLAGD